MLYVIAKSHRHRNGHPPSYVALNLIWLLYRSLNRFVCDRRNDRCSHVTEILTNR